MAGLSSTESGNAEARVSFVIPEETFTPLSFSGTVLRQNQHGMLVAVKDVSVEFYSKLLAEKRFLKLILSTGANGNEKKFTGVVQWLDFHRQGTSGLLNVGFEYVTGSLKEDTTPAT